ncbi:MAG: Mrp/NBP35 family ATP-binding protein, partial [Defluviitaleaceae bacterium]|nr:Mrp/NBP35 family ATP-binding protein [Defluviitaleaceae bacterium]
GNEKKQHVNVKVAIPEEMSSDAKQQIETEIIQSLKKEGAKTVGVLFAKVSGHIDLPKETVLTSDNPPVCIAIASGKGGVGKSTVTVNLAVAMARLGKKVGIIDSDIYGPSIPNMMGTTERPVVENNMALPVVAHGVKIISMDFFKEEDEPVIWRGPMLGKMLDVFLDQVYWGELDYLLFDLPPGTGDIALDISSRIPNCKEIIVTTPHPTAAFIAKQAGKMAIKTNHAIIGVIENMSYVESKDGQHQYLFGRGGGVNLAKELKTELLAQIPISAPKEGDNGMTAVYDELHPISEIYKEVAQEIIKVQ